jgi:hypothetical protein
MKRLSEFVNESVDVNPKGWPNVTELGDGEYEGQIWGHCFMYEGKDYFCDRGLLNISPVPAKIKIENNELVWLQ